MSRHDKPDPGFAKYHLRPELDENEDESPVKGIMAKLRRKQHSFNESDSDDDSSEYESDYELSDLSDSEIDFDESENEDSEDGSLTESSEGEEDSEDDNEGHRFNRRDGSDEYESDENDDEEIILFQPSTTSKPSSLDLHNASDGFVENDEEDAEVYDFRDIEPSFKTFQSEDDDIHYEEKLPSRGKRPHQREQGLNENRRRAMESTRSQPPPMILSRPSSNILNKSQASTKAATQQPSSSSKQTRPSVKTAIRHRPVVPPNIVKQLQSHSDPSQLKHRNKARAKSKLKVSSKPPPASPEKRLYNPKKDDPVHFQSSSSSSLQSGEVFAGRDAFGKPIYKPIHEVQQDKPNEPEQKSRRQRKSSRKGKQKAEPNETPGRSSKRPVSRRERKLYALKKQYRDIVKMEQSVKAGCTVNHHDDDSKDKDISYWSDRIALHKRYVIVLSDESRN
ncbi:hypothetical protein BKA69DRAFT_879008 [Paraphysoderma sedebokerense]|nr:hypothetical protein BKA69DRAFT_879008 [Paraphysoderma sedebokerense]